MQKLEFCPCGSKKSYQGCCAPFHNGTEMPKSAVGLMRSRYAAYAKKNIDYIISTMMGNAAKGFVREEAESGQELTHWLGLDVIRSYADPKNTDHAYVEFSAMYDFQGEIDVLHELSEFVRVGGRWWYIDGKTKKGSVNDPCPCHSGKKFKKCHGNR